MNTAKTASALVTIALVSLVACASSPQSGPTAPQPVFPRTEAGPGMTNQQAVADAEVVERLSTARCDRSQSCDRIGPGANYRDRGDCMTRMRAVVSGQLNASRCPGGIGEVGVSRCLTSLRLAECDLPGQVHTKAAHCELDLMCLK